VRLKVCTQDFVNQVKIVRVMISVSVPYHLYMHIRTGGFLNLNNAFLFGNMSRAGLGVQARLACLLISLLVYFGLQAGLLISLFI